MLHLNKKEFENYCKLEGAMPECVELRTQDRAVTGERIGRGNSKFLNVYRDGKLVAEMVKTGKVLALISKSNNAPNRRKLADLNNKRYDKLELGEFVIKRYN